MKTILFDLDGTLLPMNLEKFMKLYIGALTEKFRPYLTPDRFKEKLWTATKSMIQNTGRKRTNESVFMDEFLKNLPMDRELVLTTFHQFYKNEFHVVRGSTWQDLNMIESVSILKEKEYQLAIATNPLFPREAVLQRVKWAGLNPEDFQFITTFELMHAAKPNTEYYEELMEYLDASPGETMMIGNDALEDLAAGNLGIQTYLLTDHLLNKEKQTVLPNQEGNSKEFLEFVKAF